MRPSVPSSWRGTGADSIFVGTCFCTNDGTLLGLQTAIPQRGQRSNWPRTRHGGISVDPTPLADFWGTSGPIKRTLLGLETRGICTRLQMLEDASVIPTYRITFQRDT